MSYQSFIKSQLFNLKSPNLVKLGFDFNSNDLHSEYLKIQSLLYSEYHIKYESMLTIMKQFNIPSSKTMDSLFKLFDIEARSLSDSNRKAIETGRHSFSSSTFTHIFHKTWFNETVYLRSTYEQDFAKMLDDAKTKYLVESLRIKYFHKKQNRYRIAIPDFYLPESNTIVEVKSWYWLDPDEMRDKKESYINLGYNLNLYLDHKLIKDW